MVKDGLKAGLKAGRQMNVPLPFVGSLARLVSRYRPGPEGRKVLAAILAAGRNLAKDGSAMAVDTGRFLYVFAGDGALHVEDRRRGCGHVRTLDNWPHMTVDESRRELAFLRDGRVDGAWSRRQREHPH